MNPKQPLNPFLEELLKLTETFQQGTFKPDYSQKKDAESKQGGIFHLFDFIPNDDTFFNSIKQEMEKGQPSRMEFLDTLKDRFSHLDTKDPSVMKGLDRLLKDLLDPNLDADETPDAHPDIEVALRSVGFEHISDEEIEHNLAFWTSLKEERAQRKEHESQIHAIQKEIEQFQSQFNALHQSLPSLLSEDQSKAQEALFQMMTIQSQLNRLNEQLNTIK